jgi:hypothetical protein
MAPAPKQAILATEEHLCPPREEIFLLREELRAAAKAFFPLSKEKVLLTAGLRVQQEAFFPPGEHRNALEEHFLLPDERFSPSGEQSFVPGEEIVPATEDPFPPGEHFSLRVRFVPAADDSGDLRRTQPRLAWHGLRRHDAILNDAVKRNAARFPADFRFQVTGEVFANLMSQIVTSSACRLLRTVAAIMRRALYRARAALFGHRA